MREFFEERTGYDPKTDPVAIITLRVECNPGQVASIVNFLEGVSKQAGVYHAAVETKVGEGNGESQIQHADPDIGRIDEGRQRSQAAEGGTAESGSSDERGKVAGTAGKSSKQGPGKPNTRGKGIRAV